MRLIAISTMFLYDLKLNLVILPQIQLYNSVRGKLPCEDLHLDDHLMCNCILVLFCFQWVDLKMLENIAVGLKGKQRIFHTKIPLYSVV